MGGSCGVEINAAVQAHCLEADYGQLRNWLEEVIEERSALEARIEDLEGDKEEALDEKAALEGWVRGSVAEQAETCTRLASFQVGAPEASPPQTPLACMWTWSHALTFTCICR